MNIFQQGQGWLEPLQAALGTRPDMGHTQTGTIGHADSSQRTSLGCGKKLEHLEKTHADRGRTCKLYTECLNLTRVKSYRKILHIWKRGRTLHNFF